MRLKYNPELKRYVGYKQTWSHDINVMTVAFLTALSVFILKYIFPETSGENNLQECDYKNKAVKADL